jgi:arylsulfatase A-like enzyme
VRALGGGQGQRRVLDGGHVVDAALEWLEGERTGARFLMWVHLYDPHKWKDVVLEREGSDAPIWPGATPDGFLEQLLELHGLPPPVAGEPYTVDWRVEKKAGDPLDVRSAERFLRCIDAYDALTLFADGQVERLYRAIEALDLPGRTLWVVTSDHGEGLASHGVAGHGARIYQEQLAVPLIVHASDGSIAPRVVDATVAHVDLFATLAETLGARVHGHPGLYEGRSLWPLVRGEGDGSAWPERALFAQRRPAENDADPDQSEVYALQDRRGKYILHEPGDDEFYDLARDPLELEDLGADAPAAAALRAELEQRLRVYRSLSPAQPQGEVPEEWMEELRDLGYVR